MKRMKRKKRVRKKKTKKTVRKGKVRAIRTVIRKRVKKIVKRAIKKVRKRATKKRFKKKGKKKAKQPRARTKISHPSPAARAPKVSSKKKKEIKVKESPERAKGLTPMRIYLNQIEHIPLLRPDEELSLSRTLQLKKRGWKQARRKMINSNLRLVINIGKRYMNIGLPFSDIVEEGNIGLMRAVDKFNYRKGYRFSTYASWWIKQSIMRALSNQGKLIRIPVHMFETMSRLRKVRDYLTHKLDRAPTHKEIAKIMKISPDKVKEIEQISSSCPTSLHAPVSIESDAELMDLIEDDSLKMPHEEAHRLFKSKRIEALLNYVNDRERKILILRFGLYNYDPHTLEETAQQFGITRERVRQIEEAALKKIRYQLTLEDDKLEHYL